MIYIDIGELGKDIKEIIVISGGYQNSYWLKKYLFKILDEINKLYKRSEKVLDRGIESIKFVVLCVFVMNL